MYNRYQPFKNFRPKYIIYLLCFLNIPSIQSECKKKKLKELRKSLIFQRYLKEDQQSPPVKAETKEKVAQDGPNINPSDRVEEIFAEIPCLNDPTCNQFKTYKKSAFKAYNRFKEGSEDDIRFFISILLNRPQMAPHHYESRLAKIPKHVKEILNECLSVKKKVINCHYNQFLGIKYLINNPILPPIPDLAYFKGLISSISEQMSEEDIIKHLYLISSKSSRKGEGQVIGEMNEIIEVKKKFKYKKSMVDIESGTIVEGLIREDRAIYLLTELKYKIEIIDNNKYHMEKMDAELITRYNRLKREDGIPKNRAPDLIINNEYIADILSTTNIKWENLESLTENILIKTEDDKFKRTIHLNDRSKPNKGKRQTNRVILYVNDLDPPDIEIMTKELRKHIQIRLSHLPRRSLKEVIVIYKAKGQANLLRAYP